MSEVVDRFALREPLTQSLAWAAALQDRGWGCVVAGGAVLLMRPRDAVMTARMQRPRAIDLPLLRRLAAGAGVASIVVEPALRGRLFDDDAVVTWNLCAHDTTDVPWSRAGATATQPLAHTRTHVVDLSGGAAATLGRMHATARRNVRRALAADIDYACVSFDDVDPSGLAEVEALGRPFFATHPWIRDDPALRAALVARFGERGMLVTARREGALVGVVVLLVHDRVASYYAAFADPTTDAARVPTGLVWHAMHRAIEAGCDLFDFVGVYDERWPDRYVRWRGFSTFKRRFGGVDVPLPGAWRLPVAPP